MNKTMKIIKYVAVVAGLGVAVSVAQAQNLVSDGTFGTGTLTGSPWTSSGNVIVGTEGAAPGDTFAAVFNTGGTTANGVLSQTFATTAGNLYALTFDYGTYGYGPGQTLDVSVSGNSPFSETSPTAATPTPFELFTYDFTASGASTTLTFTDDSGNTAIGADSDGILDNVSVTNRSLGGPVPDGGSTAMLCGMSLVALGWLRRKLA